jgi:hypothetical protein
VAPSTVRLEGVDAKIVRASEHLVALEDEIVAYLSPGVARFASNVNRKTRTLRFDFELVVEPPLPLSVIVGDVVHNARSALDHLWAALIRSTDKSFPIFHDIDEWNDAKPKALRRVPTGAHTLIDSLQPCSGTDDGKLIGFLNVLSNRDKHKILNLTAAYAKESRLAIWSKANPSHRFEQDIGRFGAFKPNTYIEFTDLPDSFIQGGVDVEIKGMMTVSLKEAPFEGRNTQNVLKDILTAIRDRILPQLRPFIKT